MSNEVKKIVVEYDVVVTQTVVTTENGESSSESKVISRSTAGPKETEAILIALAARVGKAGSAVNLSTFLGAFTKGIKEADAKNRAAGKPTLAEAWSSLVTGVDSKKTTPEK